MRVKRLREILEHRPDEDEVVIENLDNEQLLIDEVRLSSGGMTIIDASE